MGQLQFAFEEFSNNPRENPDFIQPFPWPSTLRPETVYRRAINAPQAATIYSVVGNRIELNKERFPTRRGWKTLNKLLSVYRDKRFETVRYLLADKWGIIRDHAAVTSYAANRCMIVPDDFSRQNFIDQVKKQAANTSCKIILIHNHPSGNTEPSDDDIKATRSLEKEFGELFAGHVILDHGEFGLSLPGKNFETIALPAQGEDPLVMPDNKAYFGIDLAGSADKKFSILKTALQVDGMHSWNDVDWVPVVFANGAGVSQALHYYGTDEFTRANASKHIVDKTVMIGRQSGAIWAFPVTGNQALLEPVSRITRETGIFRDFYVNGTTGRSLGLGGSLARHFPFDTRFASTFPVRPGVSPLERDRQAAGDSLADGAGNRQEEQTMEKPMPEGKELSHEQHRALVEFLDRCSTPPNDALMRDYAREITGIREFKFLESCLPPSDNDAWDVYRERLAEAHRRELHSYSARFPDEPRHEFTSLPLLLEEGDRVTRTPLDFLASCQGIEDAQLYRDIYNNEPPFPRGSVRAVSPQKIALFHEGAALPLLLTDNTPANWANLYAQANNNGINVNGIIPGPEEAEKLGMGILSASEGRLRNAMSREWQEEKFRKDCALAQSRAGETGGKRLARTGERQKQFAQFPYAPGTEVPPFALEEGGKLTPYSGFAFDKLGDDGKSVVLKKWQIGQLQERITVSNKLYAEMIANAGRAANREEPQRETVARFEKMLEEDADERRSNTAANFWHNYKILCRRQASNPQDAMEVARSIVRQMPQQEQTKLRRSIKAYEKATKPLVSNPLFKPFVKPRETYNQRILAFYEENVRDLPIKNRSPHGHEALAASRHGTDAVDTPGKDIDPALKLRIGDTVKLALHCRTLFGESRKRLPAAALTVVSASADLNKIVLLDKTGRTKYAFARDEFLAKMQKLEKRLDRKQRKEDRYEAMRY